MAGFAKKFESAKQDWTTPDDLFNPINAEFKFTLDAAADATKASGLAESLCKLSVSDWQAAPTASDLKGWDLDQANPAVAVTMVEFTPAMPVVPVFTRERYPEIPPVVPVEVTVKSKIPMNGIDEPEAAAVTAAVATATVVRR